jgi:hypothetical protein
MTLLRPLALILAVLALPFAPARAATIDAVMDAAETTLAGPGGAATLKTALACTVTGCAACPAGSPATNASLAFDHDADASRSAWQHLVALIGLKDRAAADAVDGTYQGAKSHDVVDTDTAPMAALGLQAGDLADSAAIYWQSLWEVANDVRQADTLEVFELPEWTSDRAAPAVKAATARLGPLAAKLRAELRCDPAVAKLTPQQRQDLGYALHLQTMLIRGLYAATFEANAEATKAVSDAMEKAVAAKGVDLRLGPLTP